VSEAVLPEVDAPSSAASASRAASRSSSAAEIRSNLERELKGALMDRLRREVGEQLIALFARRNAAAPGRERGRAAWPPAVEQAQRQGRRQVPASA
jgi:trigger factor